MAPPCATSPTNIGLYLLTVAAAVEISLLDADEAALRLAPTLDTLEALPVWHGHPYNWYDLTTLAPLEPHYISAVDSGNYVACLMAAAQLFRQHLGELDASQRSLPARLDALAQQVELAAVYDSEAQLFFIGGDPGQGIQGNHYDLLASETRLLSFVAVCTRQVPLRHFSRLSRTQVRCGREHLLLSWSGTLFEYLLPTLLLPTYPGTLLHHSTMAAVRCQQRAAVSPLWSVSESGYYAFDPQLNYQYFAFGLPAMAADPNARSGVYAPYAAALALPYAPDKALQALEHMRTLGMWTPHGFYESVDTDPARTGEEAYRIVRSHMAHHQGMLFCALVNALTDGALVRAFCRLPMVRAYTLLLKERADLRRPPSHLPCPSPARMPWQVPPIQACLSRRLPCPWKRRWSAADTPSCCKAPRDWVSWALMICISTAFPATPPAGRESSFTYWKKAACGSLSIPAFPARFVRRTAASPSCGSTANCA